MIDAHVHLNEIDEPAAALARARAVGVERVIAVGLDLASNRQTLELAQQWPEMVLPALGYHPWSINAAGVETNLEFLAAHLSQAVAMGEVGLDYKAKVKKTLQREVFARVLALAREYDRPVIIHTRFSYQRALAMIKEAGINRAVFHWYSGPLEVLREILDAGYVISATPALAYSEPHQEAVRYAPLARILLETDAPVVYQGRRSEPADLRQTAVLVGQIKGLSLEEVQRLTTATTREFFQLPELAAAPAGTSPALPDP